MIKLMVFDLDNTLAELGKGIQAQDIALLKAIAEQGITIAICSGKPTYYLCGFLRQVGLQQPILIGENGAVIQIGVDLPPKTFHVLPYSEQAKRSIALLKSKFESLLPHLWYQPNLVGLTPFPTSEAEFECIADCIRNHAAELQDITVYRHADSFDIVPTGIDKKQGLAFLGKLLGILPEETIAIGDGINDYPMFDYAGYAVGIRVQDSSKVTINFSTTTEALQHLSNKILWES